MQFCVKANTGTLLFRGNLNGDTRIKNVKERIARQWNIPVDEQRFIYSGKQLDSWHTLDDYNVQDGATIIMLNRMAGG
jgi:hypothetical protein